MCERLPLAVVQAESEEDIVSTLRIADQTELPVAVRGAGHSSNGRALSDGIVLRLHSALAPKIQPGAEARVRVSAGARWEAVEEHLNRSGWTCPVLTDYLDLSIGGTLSVGGYGVRSITRGAQVDHVRCFRLVLASGERIPCSPEENPELFRMVLAGLAPLGVISEVEFSAARAVNTCELYTVRHDTWRELAELVGDLALGEMPQLDAAFAVREPGEERLRSVWGFDRHAGKSTPSWPPNRALAATELAARELVAEPRFRTHRRRQALLARFPDHVRLWQDFVCDARSFPRLAAVLDMLPALPCVPFQYALLIGKGAQSSRFPFEAAPGGNEQLFVGVGLYFFVPRSDELLVARVRAQLARVLESCLAIGGRPYRYGGACTLSESVVRGVYGSAQYDSFVALKRDLDPRNRFHSLESLL